MLMLRTLTSRLVAGERGARVEGRAGWASPWPASLLKAASIFPAFFLSMACGGLPDGAGRHAPAATVATGPGVSIASEEGGFQIQFPPSFSAPKRDNRSASTATGPIDFTVYSAKCSDGDFVSVTHNVYPDAAFQIHTVATMLDATRDGAIMNVSGTLIEQRDLQVSGFPARSMLVASSLSGTQLYARALMVVKAIHSGAGPVGFARPGTALEHGGGGVFRVAPVRSRKRRCEPTRADAALIDAEEAPRLPPRAASPHRAPRARPPRGAPSRAESASRSHRPARASREPPGCEHREAAGEPS